jgi:hypothetical protein
MTNTGTQGIRKIARVHDKATDKYLEVFEFPVSDLQTRTLEIQPSDVHEPKLLAKHLRNAGAQLPKDKGDRQQALDALAKADPPEEWIYEEHTGWIEDGKAFVTTTGVIGDVDTKIIGVNQSKDVKDRSGKLSVQGGWKAWREQVAEPARNSTTLMLSISAALAAPLLAFTGGQSFSINLFGPTRAGKSVATVAAASVIGIGRERDLISWKISNARLEQRLPEFNDAIFPIDDLDKLSGTDKKKYERIRELAYSISHGFATARHSSFTEAHEGAHKSWSSILLTSCQFSAQQLAHAAKMERQHGEALRLIDVPAVFGGSDHIFDGASANATNNEDWRSHAFTGIAEACEQNHGKPFRKYIKALIAKRATLKDEVASNVSSFVGSAGDKFDGAITRDVARKFGLIYAGGLFGIQCRLLPWTEAELRDAVLKSFVAARDLLPDKGVLLRSGIAALRAKLRQLPSVSMPIKKRDTELDYGQLHGYRVSTPEDNRYVIKVEIYKQIFSSSEQRDLVTNRLAEKNRITLAIAKKPAINSDRKPKEQVTWPDQKRRRSIEIVWKKKKKKKAKKKPAAKKAE